MERWRAVGLIAVALALGFVAGFKSGQASGPDVLRSPEVALAELPRLVELGSTTCVPCKKMAPILEELRREYSGKVEVQFIDVHVDVAAADRYGVNVIPTQLFFDKDGQEVFRHEGFYPKSDILAQFEKMGIRTH